MQIHIQGTDRGTPTVTLAASGVLTGSAWERLESWDPSRADERAWSRWKAGLFAGVARSQGRREGRSFVQGLRAGERSEANWVDSRQGK